MRIFVCFRRGTSYEVICIGYYALSGTFDVRSKVADYANATHDNFFCTVTGMAVRNISYGNPTPSWTYNASSGSLSVSAGWSGEYPLYCSGYIYYISEPLPPA
ncbi:hypothetical protein bpr_II206 (plasmid) [Butyrivibrio proteoclasticus B316]|uniref:Uncharacterized protein n=1 Tax=Butyrivibrio proteoclasticus (strain ATCC 51982 / DSM 14932 / B316) TaxID=515622 RepID=E0S412_BUTPB|nr:hypothetical protein [Butyrivibrio proteoclasticus]ADL36144.1 hypothetical protein bpr_II206 [Butyrivibrio proteoclasticus B316]